MPALDLAASEAEEELFGRLSELPTAQRNVVAIAGAPGTGKSALAERLTVRLNQSADKHAAVLPVDGFMLDDVLLSSMGRLAHKGAPDTFDVGGLIHMIRRLKSNTEAAVAVPVYDYQLGIARSAGRLIRKSTSIVILDGNYLLSEEMPWAPLAGSFDLTAMIDVSEMEMRRKLEAHWAEFGLSPARASEQIEQIDLPN
ncbi:MAG: nucleoside/nucleotide kinase family protein, partial [Pseudomonadota bacterium]